MADFPELQVGINGLEVLRWQKFLVIRGFISDDPAISGDGMFGMGTRKGTEKYQSFNNLEANSVVDAPTHDKAIENGFKLTD